MGWQFTLPDIFKSMAREGFMPSAFAYTNRFGAPAKGMLILTLIQTAMAFMVISPNLNQQFEILVNLATIANLISYILITAKKQKEMAFSLFAATVGGVYSLYAAYASGFEAMTYGSLVVFAGMLFYGYISSRYDLETSKA